MSLRTHRGDSLWTRLHGFTPGNPDYTGPGYNAKGEAVWVPEDPQVTAARASREQSARVFQERYGVPDPGVLSEAWTESMDSISEKYRDGSATPEVHEWETAWRRPFEARKYALISLAAKQWALQDHDGRGDPARDACAKASPDDVNNARRHQFWSAWLTYTMGPEKAERWLASHEVAAVEHGSLKVRQDHRRDMVNNEIGQEIGLSVRTDFGEPFLLFEIDMWRVRHEIANRVNRSIHEQGNCPRRRDF